MKKQFNLSVILYVQRKGKMTKVQSPFFNKTYWRKTMIEKKFVYHVIKGTPFEAGRQQAQMLLELDPGARQFFANPFPPRADFLKKTEEMLEVFERFSPGLNQELAGFAKEMECSPQEVVYYTFSLTKIGLCSHFSVGPNNSSDGHHYVGRNYEWNFESDMRLVHTNIEGRYAHTGFSALFFGRLDGMNETGLTLTMSAGDPTCDDLPEGDGFFFWVLTRRILDECSSCEEAVKIAKSFPIVNKVNIIVADNQGNSVLIEKTPQSQGESWNREILWSTNHFTLPETSEPDLKKMRNSLIRHQRISEVLKGDSIHPDSMVKLMETPYPEGLCFEHFSDFMGSLWSILYDVTEKKMVVCFGPPNHPENPRLSFSPLSPGDSRIIAAQFNDIPANMDDFEKI